MKKLLMKLCWLTCIALLGVSCTNSVKLTGNEFIIEGQVSGVEDGTVITLLKDGDMFNPIASDTIKNGRFFFKEEAESDIERLDILPTGEGIPSMRLIVWVAPKAKIKISGEGKLHVLWDVKSSVPLQKEENRYKDNSRDVIAESARISIEINSMFPKMRAATSPEETLVYKNIVDSLVALSDSLLILRLYANIDIMENTDVSLVWLIKMQSIASLSWAPEFSEFRGKLEKAYSKMSEEDKNTPIGNEITNFVFPPHPSALDVGGYFADVDLLDTNGNIKRIVDYLGKYLLLDFWNIGCKPCIMALPEMKEISEIYADKLTIISISLDNDTNWKKALAEHDMPWVNIRDPKDMGGLASAYGVYAIPNYVLISPEGKVVDKWAGYGTGSLKQKMSENIN